MCCAANEMTLVVPPNAAERLALSNVSALSTPAAETCSMWAWLSTPPGSTSLPDASISRSPAASPCPIATLAEGPFGIESQRDVEAVTLPLRRMVEEDNAADAFVIACYSDPGLHACREGTRRPVFGIAECAVLTVLARADRFGVIAIAQP